MHIGFEGENNPPTEDRGVVGGRGRLGRTLRVEGIWVHGGVYWETIMKLLRRETEGETGEKEKRGREGGQGRKGMGNTYSKPPGRVFVF
jgi:hypothetical protein